MGTFRVMSEREDPDGVSGEHEWWVCDLVGDLDPMDPYGVVPPMERHVQDQQSAELVTGWRGACECGWRGPIFPRVRELTEDPDEIERYSDDGVAPHVIEARIMGAAGEHFESTYRRHYNRPMPSAGPRRREAWDTDSG